MQGDRRLARTGAALDLGDRRGGGADHQVLLRLDGGDDVTHGVAAGLAERRHQGTVADDRELGAVQGGGQLRTHQVVLDTEDLAPLGTDDPAAHHPSGVDRGRAVERGSGGGAPVDDHGRVVGVEDADPADVQGLADLGGVVRPYGVVGGLDGGVRAVGALLAVLAVQQVDTAEEEVLELAVETVEVDARSEDLGVPLGECAGGADLTALGGVVHQEFRLVDLLLEAAVHPVEMFLFDTDLAVSHRVGGRTDHGIHSGILRGHRGPLLTCTGQPSTVREGGRSVRRRPPPVARRRRSGSRSDRCRRGPSRLRRARTAAFSRPLQGCPGCRIPTWVPTRR